MTTQEGVTAAWIDAIHIVNQSAQTDRVNAKRRELHVAGKTYNHVGEDNTGQWTYRYDK